jgi:hypothetical protein
MSQSPHASGDEAQTSSTPSPDKPTSEHTQDIRTERAALLRDFIQEALEPVKRDAPATRLCLRNNDDAGTGYHLKRIIAGVTAAASTFGELEEVIGGGQ